jgi:hypothetical protein
VKRSVQEESWQTGSEIFHSRLFERGRPGVTGRDVEEIELISGRQNGQQFLVCHHPMPAVASNTRAQNSPGSNGRAPDHETRITRKPPPPTTQNKQAEGIGANNPNRPHPHSWREIRGRQRQAAPPGDCRQSRRPGRSTSGAGNITCRPHSTSSGAMR